MLRSLVDLVRRILIGPNLMALSRMPKDDLSQIIQLGSDRFLFTGELKETSSPSRSGAEVDEVQELKQKVAFLVERVDVLERALLESRSSHAAMGLKKHLEAQTAPH